MDSDTEAIAKQYARKTRQRMALAIGELLVIERAGLRDASRLLAWMEEQERASRGAGFAGVARLCGTVSDCLAGLQRGEQPVLVPMVGTLLEVCRTVRLHAESVAKTRPHVRSVGRAKDLRRESA
jgi:hypothetical protein